MMQSGEAHIIYPSSYLRIIYKGMLIGKDPLFLTIKLGFESLREQSGKGLLLDSKVRGVWEIEFTVSNKSYLRTITVTMRISICCSFNAHVCFHAFELILFLSSSFKFSC